MATDVMDNWKCIYLIYLLQHLNYKKVMMCWTVALLLQKGLCAS